MFIFCFHLSTFYIYIWNTNIIRSTGGGLALRRDIPSRDVSSMPVLSGSDVWRDDWSFPMTVYNRGGCKFLFQLWLYIYIPIGIATCLWDSLICTNYIFLRLVLFIIFSDGRYGRGMFRCALGFLKRVDIFYLVQRTITFTYKHNMSSSSSTQQAMVAMEWVDTEVTGDMWVCAQAKSFWNLPDVCCALFCKEEILFGNKFMWYFLFVSIAVPSKYFRVVVVEE